VRRIINQIYILFYSMMLVGLVYVNVYECVYICIHIYMYMSKYVTDICKCSCVSVKHTFTHVYACTRMYAKIELWY
jgi:hypothetical protein